jgi:DNA-directed RNA polymerase subunit RPC12/RpoP
MIRVIGVFQIVIGALIIIGGVVAGASWLAFCFGSVVIGILLLIFSPEILLFPFGLSVFGVSWAKAGYRNVVVGERQDYPVMNISSELTKIGGGIYACGRCGRQIHDSEREWDVMLKYRKCPKCNVSLSLRLPL